MTVERYNSSDISNPLKKHLWKITGLLNLQDIRKPVHLDPIDLSTGSPTEAVFEIPNWANKIELMINGVSLDGGTDEVTCYAGTAGALEKDDYDGASARIAGSNNLVGVGGSNGFRVNQTNASATFYGAWVLTRLANTSDIWIGRATIARDDTSQIFTIAGSIDLGGPLDRVALSRTGSTDAFDAGTVGCRYER